MAFKTKSAIGDSTSFIKVDTHGARKLLTLNNTTLLIETKRGDGKNASTHPCTPNFANKENSYGLAQHGPARDAEWTVIDETEDSITLNLHIEGGTYPPGLRVMQTLRVTPGKFELYTVHINAGKEQMPVIYGEHFYWKLNGDVNQVTLNGNSISKAEGFTDKFSTTGIVFPLLTENTIQIPGLPAITLEQEIMPVAVAWQGKGDTEYVCIEPVTMNPQLDENGQPTFGSEKSMLKPGETKTTYLAISLKAT